MRYLLMVICMAFAFTACSKKKCDENVLVKPVVGMVADVLVNAGECEERALLVSDLNGLAAKIGLCEKSDAAVQSLLGDLCKSATSGLIDAVWSADAVQKYKCKGGVITSVAKEQAAKLCGTAFP